MDHAPQLRTTDPEAGRHLRGGFSDEPSDLLHCAASRFVVVRETEYIFVSTLKSTFI